VRNGAPQRRTEIVPEEGALMQDGTALRTRPLSRETVRLSRRPKAFACALDQRASLEPKPCTADHVLGMGTSLDGQHADSNEMIQG
jgi:hypothetical protein